MREVVLINTKSYKVTLSRLVWGKMDRKIEQNIELKTTQI